VLNARKSIVTARKSIVIACKLIVTARQAVESARMTRVELLENEIRKLTPDEFAELREWLLERDWGSLGSPDRARRRREA
jgi:hypothetical protein